MEFPRSFGKALAAFAALIIPTVTAGAAGDGVEVDGETIDREDAHSACFVVTAKATLQATETMTVKATLQESDDGSSWTDVAAELQPGGAADSTVLTFTGGAGGSTEQGAYKLPVNLGPLKRYVRIQAKPDLSASGTDTGTVAVTCLLGGLVIEPPA